MAKIPLDAGFTCPTRDGRIARVGCLYCDARGSGTGAAPQPISEQLQAWAERLKRRGIRKFIAYFQAYTNTYGDLEQMENLYEEALHFPGVVGLAVGTRPDCLSEPVLELLERFACRTYFWLELGLESPNWHTLRRVVRGHGLAEFIDAVLRAKAHGLRIGVHLIAGLPGDTRRDLIEAARLLTALKVHGVKLHPLFIVRSAPFARLYEEGKVRVLELEEYARWAADFLEHLSAEILILRLSGDVFSDELIAPLWLRNKGSVLAAIEGELRRRGTHQGAKARLGLLNSP